MNFIKEDSHLSEEAVALYVDALKLGVLDKVPQMIRDHVSECPACKIEIEELFLLLEDEKYEKTKPHPFFNPQPRSGKDGISLLYRIAAVFLLALGFYGVYQLYRPAADPQMKNTAAPNGAKAGAPVDTSAAKEGGKLLADRFAESPILEDLVRTEYRSGTIEILSPALNAEMGESMTFQWAHAPGDRVILKILSNAGREVHSAATGEARYIFRGKLAPGLYYWKLESNEELLFAGKFLKK